MGIQRWQPDEGVLLHATRVGWFVSYTDHVAHTAALVQALKAYKDAEAATDHEMEMRERSLCEGWDNDPTGATHVVSAVLASTAAWKKAKNLARAALDGQP